MQQLVKLHRIAQIRIDYFRGKFSLFHFIKNSKTWVNVIRINLKSYLQKIILNIKKEHMAGPEGNIEMKMDIMMHNSYQKVKKQCIKVILWTTLKALLLIIFTIINYAVVTNQTNVITLFLGFAIVITCLNIFLDILFFCVEVRKQQNILILAIESNHAVKEPDTIGLVSQRIYNAENRTEIDSEGLTQQIKNKQEQITENLLRQAIIDQNPRYDCSKTIVSLALFWLLIFGIVALTVGSPNTPQLVVIIIFLVFQAFSHILALIVLLLIALSPLLCCIACFISCCCLNSEQQPDLPEPVPATMPMINQAGKDCSICYQSFKVDNPVVQLRCSPKHMFHPICISGWIKISQSCPICRKDLNGNSK